jgi:hypothetical protein
VVPELRDGLRDLGVLGAVLYLPAVLLALALAWGIRAAFWPDPSPGGRERRLRRAARTCRRLALLALLGGVILAASLVWEYALVNLRYGRNATPFDASNAWTRFFAGVPAGAALAVVGLAAGGLFRWTADRAAGTEGVVE